MDDNQMRVVHKTPTERTEWIVSFDEIGHKLVYKSYPKTIKFLALGFTAILVTTLIVMAMLEEDTVDTRTLTILLLTWPVLGLLIYFFSDKNDVYLTGGAQNIIFFRNKPSEKEVDGFIELIISKSKDYLIQKNGQIDLDLPEEVQMNQFYWLRNSNIISEDEFERLKTDLKTKKLM